MQQSVLAGVAAVLLLSVPASAQMKDAQRGSEERATPSQRDSGQAQQGQPDDKAVPEPKRKGETGKQDRPGKGTAEKASPQDDRAKRGTAERGDSKEKATKGTAERDSKEKGTKGTAERGDSKEKGTKGTAERDSKEKGTKGAAEKSTRPKDDAARAKDQDRDKAQAKDKSAQPDRKQLSSEQRSNVGQTLLKQSNVNKVDRLNVSIRVGTRLPRSVHLAVLPAPVIAIVPEYRTYRYVVVGDEIIIVHPSTYEIVEVITVSGQRVGGGGGHLTLSEAEREIILSEIDFDGSSTLGLGAVSVGADVPRNVRVVVFPTTVVEKVPKLRGYRYFTAENRIAVVGPEGDKVHLVIEGRR